MRVCPFALLFYPMLFFCLLATRPVWAGWQGNPPLKMEYNEHEFLAACREGNVAAVEFYLAAEDFDPNRYFESGYNTVQTTGLYVAAQNGHDEVVQILADTKGVDLNQTYDGTTPVFIASQKGHDQVVEILAHSKGVDLNRTWRGITPVFIASQQGHDKVVQILADTEGVDLNQTWNDATPVFIASQQGHDKVVQILAHTEGVNLNRACDGATPVLIASQQGHDKVVQILAHTDGVDLNHTFDGATPVYIASQKGHDKVVQILVDAGADPTIRWKHGWGIFSKTARTIATQSRPFLKKRNPEKYDAYSSIIQTLKLAEQQWKIKNAIPITPIDDRNHSHWDDSENIPLLHHLRRLSVTGECP